VEAAGFETTILPRRMTILRTVAMGYSITPDAIKFYLKTALDTTIQRAITRIEQSIGMFTLPFITPEEYVDQE